MGCIPLKVKTSGLWTFDRTVFACVACSVSNHEHERRTFAYLTIKNDSFARFARFSGIFHVFRFFLSTTVNDLFGRCVDNLSVRRQSFNLVTFLTQCRSKGNISGGPRERRRREPLEGSGGMLPQKILKSRGLEMPFPAFSKSYL